MRALRAPVVIAALFIVSGPVACGLDAGGRLTVADAGGAGMMTVMDDDAASVASSDGDVPDESADDATTLVDGASPVRADGSVTAHPDAGPAKDAAADVAAPVTCTSCVAAMCPDPGRRLREGQRVPRVP